jgi:hypothetical protein
MLNHLVMKRPAEQFLRRPAFWASGLLKTLILLVVACLMVASSLRADTRYTYAGNPYTSCDGTYLSAGVCGPYSLSVSFVIHGGPLAASTLYDTPTLSALVSSFSFSDRSGLVLTQVNSVIINNFEVLTDSSGAIHLWSLAAAHLGCIPIPPNTDTTCDFMESRNDGATEVDDLTELFNPPPVVVGSGASSAPGVWSVSNPNGAADLAKALIDPLVDRNLYLSGAKGWDWMDGRFVEPTDIKTDYHFLWSDRNTQGRGLDCSGLIFWSYNKAFGATAYQPRANPNPVFWEGAEQQYFANVQPQALSASALQPGDLLFFNYLHGWDCVSGSCNSSICRNVPLGQRCYIPAVDHVAMYVGPTTDNPEGAVVEAYSDDKGPDGLPVGVISSSCSITAGCTRATEDPVFDEVCSNNNDKPGSCVFRTTGQYADLDNCSTDPSTHTTPCFVGYRRLGPPNIAWQARTHSPVELVVTDPDGFTITAQTLIPTEREQLREIPGALYYSEWQIGGDGTPDAMVSAPTIKTGDYLIGIVAKGTAAPTDTYSLDVQAVGNNLTLAQNVPISQIPPLGYGIQSDGATIVVFIPVAIDIKPGSVTNPINPASNGTTTVAILSNASLNAPSAVDTSSLMFGRTGAEQSLAFCDSSGEDVNGDGLLDLVCHFYTQNTGFQAGDAKGVLKGRTIGGSLIKGDDLVRIAK